MSTQRSAGISNSSVAAANSSPPAAVPTTWSATPPHEDSPYEVRLTFADKQAARGWAMWLAALPGEGQGEAR